MTCTPDCVAPSPSQAHCGAEGCHRTFGGVSGFDSHRVGGRCVDPATITKDGGMHQDARGIWRRNVDRVHPRAVRRTPRTADEPSLVGRDTLGGPKPADSRTGLETWLPDPPPGGWVCAEPDAEKPDGICGMPVESEPCPIHHPLPDEDVIL